MDLLYLPFNGPDGRKQALERFQEESVKARFDFVECLAYSSSEFVLMLGQLTSESNGSIPVNSIGNWYKPWFFTHVQSKFDRSTAQRELIPLRHYYHRHSKSLFWEIQDIVPFGNNLIFRWLLGWMMPPKPALLKITQTEALRKLYEQHHVVQDMLLPIQKLDACLDVFHKEIGVYPLWLCPFKIPNNGKAGGVQHRGFVKPLPLDCSNGHTSSGNDCKGVPLEAESMFVDVGAYGNPTVKGFNAKETCRRLEEFIRQERGYQMMYADSYMTK